MSILYTVFVSTFFMGDVLSYYKSSLEQIVFSHILFRHGERMPLEFFPNDQYKDSNWPFKIAQLTDEGQRQEYELGKWARTRYDHLISKRFDPDQLYAVSTDTDRTLMSAQCFLEGLYTKGAVPVHTTPCHLDKLLGAAVTSPCPAYNAEMLRANSLPEVKQIIERYTTLFEYVSEQTGYKVQDCATAIKVYDVLSIEEKYNMSLPDWVHSIYPEPIKEAGLYSFVLPTWTTKLQRLKIGPLLKEIAEHFLAKKAGSLTPNRSVWVYSVHDATLSALLNTLKAFEIHFPPYAACILLELRFINLEYYVTLSYRNRSSEDPLLLIMKGCSGWLCPLDQFIDSVEPLVPDDWDQECELQQHTCTYYILFSVLILIGVIACAIVVHLNLHILKKDPQQRIMLQCRRQFHHQ